MRSLQVCSDGPNLFLKFTVPESLGLQLKEFDFSTQKFMESCHVPMSHRSIQVLLAAQEAHNLLLTRPTPMRPAINQQ